MTMAEVNALLKAPGDMKRHETGKRWIPFYYGGDAQRVQVYYEGEGCLTYTGGAVFGGGGNQLIRITADPTKACFPDGQSRLARQCAGRPWLNTEYANLGHTPHAPG